MNQQVLISTSILSALWETHNKDTIELLLPFMKYAIAKNTSVDENLDIGHITEYFKKEFGYDDIPSNVMLKMLNRLTPNILKKSNKKFILVVNLDKTVVEFEKQRIKCKERESSVINCLTNYLHKNSKMAKNFTEDDVVASLIDFFYKQGLNIYWDIQTLEMLSKNQNQVDYFIAQFIIEESKNNSCNFDYLIEMVKGFFISTAISLQTNNDSSFNSKFSEVCFYLDTRLILNALGYHLKEEKQSTIELLNMLQNKKAKLFLFEHNYQEVYNIIFAYKKSITKPRLSRTLNTLTGLDELNYTPDDVDRLLLNLKENIRKLNIEIIDTPEYDIEKSRISFIDETGLHEYIKEEMSYRRSEALEVDIRSISAICRLRNGLKTNYIEKCGALFVTSNSYLVRLSNVYLKKHNVLDKHCVPISISDMDLSAIVWLKNYSTNKNYPKLKLLENAILMLEPSQSLLMAFHDKIQKIKLEGGLTEDEAAILQMDRYCKRELVLLTHGEVETISDETIITIKQNFIAEHMKNITEEFNDKIENNEKLADEKFKLTLESYEYEKKKRKDVRDRAASEIALAGKNAKESVEKKLKIALYIIYPLVFFIVLVCLFYSINTSNSALLITTVVIFIFNSYSLIESLFSKKKMLFNVITQIGDKAMHKKKEKKRKELSEILGDLMFED